VIFPYSNRWQVCVRNCAVYTFKAEIRGAVKGKKGVQLSKDGLKATKKTKISGEGKLKNGNYLERERDVNSSRNGSILIAVCHKIP
jgi:hypothetical protein